MPVDSSWKTGCLWWYIANIINYIVFFHYG
jgi:hypothetical protein